MLMTPQHVAAMTTTPYDAVYYQERLPPTEASARRIVPMVLELVRPGSVIDVGCGSGIWLATARDAGVSEIRGVDGPWVEPHMLKIPKETFEAHDLSKPLRMPRTYDLALSIEVAEHLPGAVADQFVESLCSLAPVILFSAAVPGQRGTDHINEQWQSYWRERFEAHGYVAIDAIRPRIWEDDSVAPIYRQNTALYCQRDSLGRYPALQDADSRTGGWFPDVVHPGVFQGAVARSEDLKAIAIESFKRALGPARPLARRAKRALGR